MQIQHVYWMSVAFQWMTHHSNLLSMSLLVVDRYLGYFLLLCNGGFSHFWVLSGCFLFLHFFYFPLDVVFLSCLFSMIILLPYFSWRASFIFDAHLSFVSSFFIFYLFDLTCCLSLFSIFLFIKFSPYSCHPTYIYESLPLVPLEFHLFYLVI